MKLYTFVRDDETVIEQVRAEHWQHALAIKTSDEVDSQTSYYSEDVCSRCNEVDVKTRVITDDPYFGICEACRKEINEYSNKCCSGEPMEVPEGETCTCCKKDIGGEYLKASGFGGYRDPKPYFTCQECVDESQAEYERQMIETELSGRFDY